MARLCLVDQRNDRIAQGAVPGKEHARVRPEAIWVESWDPRESVVPAGMAVAAQVSRPAQDPEDAPAGYSEGAPQLIEPGDRMVAEQLLQLLDIGITGCVYHSYD